MTPEERNKIRVFVRDTLGCRCPEEVFRIIEVKREAELSCGVQLRAKINIGNRLLVYLMDFTEEKDKIRAALAEGVAEREALGFNRIRLVLLADNSSKPSPLIALPDEKAHLHVIGREMWVE